MKTTPRFEKAVTTLYTAFHNGTLDAMDCKHCAVGNMCGNSQKWVNGSSIGCMYRVKKNKLTLSTGYSIIELMEVEHLFIYGTRSNESNILFENNIASHNVKLGVKTKEEQKELQFKGLCAVVKYLCELDNIPDITDYTSLFETVEGKPVKELQF